MMYKFKQIYPFTLITVLLAACWCLPATAQGYLYRYVNKDGVKVLNHTIPPEYTQNGYEILSNTGQVIRVVPPAPSEGEVAEEYLENQLREKFVVLKRRYKSIEDIENAKRRRQENLNTNISILRGNIGSINTHIENLMQEAANMERSGRSVSQQLLQKLTDARSELAVSESSLENRMEEYRKVTDRFEQDIVTFMKGSELTNPESIN